MSVIDCVWLILTVSCGSFNLLNCTFSSLLFFRSEHYTFLPSHAFSTILFADRVRSSRKGGRKSESARCLISRIVHFILPSKLQRVVPRSCVFVCVSCVLFAVVMTEFDSAPPPVSAMWADSEKERLELIQGDCKLINTPLIVFHWCTHSCVRQHLSALPALSCLPCTRNSYSIARRSSSGDYQNQHLFLLLVVMVVIVVASLNTTIRIRMLSAFHGGCQSCQSAADWLLSLSVMASQSVGQALHMQIQCCLLYSLHHRCLPTTTTANELLFGSCCLLLSELSEWRCFQRWMCASASVCQSLPTRRILFTFVCSLTCLFNLR